MNLRLKIPPPVIGLTTAFIMWFLAKRLPMFDFDLSYRIGIALAVALIGLLIDILALLNFKSAKTTINPMKPEKTSELVSSGIYQFTRNPMYLGLLILLIAWAIYLANYFAFFILPVFIIYITVFQIIPEEKVMQAHFSEQYTDYKSKVRRWI